MEGFGGEGGGGDEGLGLGLGAMGRRAQPDSGGAGASGSAATSSRSSRGIGIGIGVAAGAATAHRGIKRELSDPNIASTDGAYGSLAGCVGMDSDMAGRSMSDQQKLERRVRRGFFPAYDMQRATCSMYPPPCASSKSRCLPTRKSLVACLSHPRRSECLVKLLLALVMSGILRKARIYER